MYRIAYDGVTLIEKVELALTFWRRLTGLFGSQQLDTGSGLLIRPCHSVHTIGMRYPIDLVFLSADCVVISTVSHLKPYRSSTESSAYQVLELASGEVCRLGINEQAQLTLERNWEWTD